MFRSNPVVTGNAGKPRKYRVYSAAKRCPVDIVMGENRLPGLRWDLSTRNGIICRTGHGHMYDGVLGTIPYVATCRNRGGSSLFSSCPRDWIGRPSRAPGQLVEDGVPVLRFDGSGTYFTIPGAVIPRYSAYRLSFEFRPDGVDREQELFACGTKTIYGPVGYLRFGKGGLKALITGVYNDDTYLEAKGTVKVGEWNRVDLAWNVDTAELSLNGTSSGKVPCVMPGRSDTPAWFGGVGERLFAGSLRNVSVAYGD